MEENNYSDRIANAMRDMAEPIAEAIGKTLAREGLTPDGVAVMGGWSQHGYELRFLVMPDQAELEQVSEPEPEELEPEPEQIAAMMEQARQALREAS